MDGIENHLELGDHNVEIGEFMTFDEEPAHSMEVSTEDHSVAEQQEHSMQEIQMLNEVIT